MTTARAGARPTSRATEFEVATTTSDALRAGISVAGTLSDRTCPLLLSVIHAHLRAGRRYLRVDLAGAAAIDLDLLGPLRDLHTDLTAIGGMLVFENASGRLAGALRDADLFVRAAL